MNCLEVTKIRKKVKGYIKNITENKIEEINENAIITKNKITYNSSEIKHTIYIKDKEIILIRENKEFKNILTFKLNKSIISEYIIKEKDIHLEINIKTLLLEINSNYILIKYLIEETNIIYEYKLLTEE